MSCCFGVSNLFDVRQIWSALKPPLKPLRGISCALGHAVGVPCRLRLPGLSPLQRTGSLGSFPCLARPPAPAGARGSRPPARTRADGYAIRLRVCRDPLAPAGGPGFHPHPDAGPPLPVVEAAALCRAAPPPAAAGPGLAPPPADVGALLATLDAAPLCSLAAPRLGWEGAPDPTLNGAPCRTRTGKR